MSAPSQVAVVGSANLDIVVPVHHHPVRGETVLGGDHLLAPGGKGANQAVAAARLGANVIFVGAVGTDSAGETLTASLVDAGVDTTHLRSKPDVPSGIALITVDKDGDNAIVVSSGANAHVSQKDVADAASELRSSDVLLLQLETPIDTVIAAAQVETVRVVLDPAPAPSEPLPAALLQAIDVLVPNETELAALAGLDTPPEAIEDVVMAARILQVPVVIVTMGARGAVIVTDGKSEHVPAPSVTPVDTTAAGDAFRAALGVELGRGHALVDAVRFAVRVGAATTLRIGAQPSLPTRAEVEDLLA
jgi:ribokinase